MGKRKYRVRNIVPKRTRTKGPKVDGSFDILTLDTVSGSGSQVKALSKSGRHKIGDFVELMGPHKTYKSYKTVKLWKRAK